MEGSAAPSQRCEAAETSGPGHMRSKGLLLSELEAESLNLNPPPLSALSSDLHFVLLNLSLAAL